MPPSVLPRSQLLLRFAKCARLFQRRNQFVERAYRSAFSISEAHVAIELEASPGAGFLSLQRVTGLPKSSLSQALSALERRKILARTAGSDKRGFRFTLSGAGTALMRDYHERANGTLASLLSGLSRAAQDELTRLFGEFADGLQAAPLHLPPPAPELRAQLGRVTRVFGLPGRRLAFAPRFSRFDWHILGLLEERRASPSVIADELHLERSSVSLSLRALESRGFIARSPSAVDRRGREVCLTPQGRSALAEIENGLVQFAARGMSAWTDVRLQRFVELFAELSGVEWDKMASGAGVTERIEDDAARALLRAFYIRQIAGTEVCDVLPAELFGARGRSFALMRGGEFEACVEFQREGKHWLLANLAARSDLSSAEVRRFVDEARAHVQTARAKDAVRIDPSAARFASARALRFDFV